MKISLIQCPAFEIDRPPLSLAYLNAVLREHRYEVKIHDFNIDLFSGASEDNKLFWDFKYVYNWIEIQKMYERKVVSESIIHNWTTQVLANKPDIIGFSVYSSSLALSLILAKDIKKIDPKKIIIFGGPLTTCHTMEGVKEILKAENESKTKAVDIIIFGEGENTLLEAIQRIKTNQSLIGCSGTLFREKEEIVENPGRELIVRIDNLPFPSFDGFEKKYLRNKYLPILGSRGCINKCIFCDDCKVWKYYRFRSAENIFSEMKLRKKQGIDFLDFNDLLINGNYKELSKLCDMIIKDKLKISWGGSACIHENMTQELLRKLRKSGCDYLTYGIESASPDVLKDMNKNFKIEVAEKVIKDTYEAGISACVNFIVGFPTETHEDFMKTYTFVEKNMNYFKKNIMVNSFIIKGASELYNKRDLFGIKYDENGNWYSQDGKNNKEERKKRYDLMINLISSFGDKPSHENFHN